MGKKKKQAGNKKGGSRFFRWIRSDLPDQEDTKSPVLLLGVTKISDSPSLSRRRQSESSQHSGTGSGRFCRPPKSKYTRGLNGDERLERIRQDLQTHRNQQHIPDLSSSYPQDKPKEQCDSKRISKQVTCLALNCVGSCNCERDRSIRSSNRGSFLFHRPDIRQSSLCPSVPYEPCSTQSGSAQDYADNYIEHRFSEQIPTGNGSTDPGMPSDSSGRSNTQSYYSVTPKSSERRSLLLSNLNERFRKTLSLDSRKVESNRVPLSLPQSRPKSMVQANISPKSCRSDDTFIDPQQDKTANPKKRRFRPKSFFSLETFFDSKRSDSSSVDDYSSSKYKKFELESDESPVFRDRVDFSGRRQARDKECTPDLLDLPFIIDSVRKKGEQSGTKRQLEKLESHYYRNLGRTVVDAVPKDATDPCIAQYSNAHNRLDEDDEVEYIEPIRSNFTSQSTLIIDSKHEPSCEIPYPPTKPDSALSIITDETDIRVPSSNLTISPNSYICGRLENDEDSIGAFEIEVKESDFITDRTKDLIVKIMDKSIDSIGSCSLDVDASTDFSDTTSGSLNLLTPSSTTSRIRDFTSRLQERAASTTAPPAGCHLLAQASPHPPRIDRPPPKLLVDAASHRSRSKKPEHKKPSYLNLACSVNGYSNLTTYDSKLRQNINKSREASPIRPITHTYYRGEIGNTLVVPVPVSADKLIVPTFQPHDTKRAVHLTDRAPAKAHTDPYLATSPVLVYMAAENRQLKSNFLGKNMATTAGPAYSESQKFAASMLHQSETNDEVDNVSAGKEVTFKSSYSETNITSKKVCSTTFNGEQKESSFSTAESYTIHKTNGISKHVDITKENGETLTSPMKSFIQQRVERLYGPGALAQGFFNQKRYKNKSQTEAEETISEANKVLTEKSLNCPTGERLYSYPSRGTKETQDRNNENVERTSPDETKSPALPVLRHLRPEFRAQLPVLSPKKSPGRTDFSTPPVEASPQKSPVKTETNGCPAKDTGVNSAVISVSECVDRVKLDGERNGVVGAVEVRLNGDGPEVRLNGEDEEVRDAYYFLDLEKRETERLIQLAVSAERHLESLQEGEASEEVLGLLRAAAGKARLLATQKMQQFEGLCYNNINARDGEQFPTTLEDLQGFWDMVCLQVRNVEQLHRQIETMRAAGWRETEPAAAASPSGASPRAARTPRASPAGRTPRAPAPAAGERARLAAERREADRRTMLEQRRRMAREKQMAAKSCAPGTSREDQRDMAIEGSQEVEIFIGGGAKKKTQQGDQATPSRSHDSRRDS